MTATIESMAREAGLVDAGDSTWFSTGLPGDDYSVKHDHLARFAELVRADERERCAKACEQRVTGDNNREDAEAKRCAAAIRAMPPSL